MSQIWEKFKTMKSSLLVAIYANKLHTYQVNRDLILHSVEPLLYIRKYNTSDITYWKIDWTEDHTGDDILLLQEQQTPEPLLYELTEEPYQKHIILGSSFSVQHKLIENVCGYGFKDNQYEFVSSIVLELEDLFIHIKAGAVIEMQVTESRPCDLGELIFST